MSRHFSDEFEEKDIGVEVTVAGWVEDVRTLGSLVFITLRDSHGFSQLVVKKEASSELYEACRKLSKQSVISASGSVQQSRSKQVKYEVKIAALEILSHAIHPLPLDPTGRIEAGLDVRLDARALDLRSPRNQAIFKLRHQALQSIRSTLVQQGFLEVNTSKIIGQAAEGGAALFSVNYFDGKQVFLAQSPQLYKEQLTLALDKVFEISSYFRAEKSHTTRHLNEFTSVDIEASFMNEVEAMNVCESIVVSCMIELLNTKHQELNTLHSDLRIPSSPFEEVTYAESIDYLKSMDLDIDYGDDLSDSNLAVIGKKNNSFFFLTKWPPKLKPFYIAEDPNTQLTRSFDLQYGPLELASGGMRIHQKEILIERIKSAGLPLDSFSSHLSAFDWGMPPHSGWGFGFDRFMMVLTGMKNIREVVLYPRDQYRISP
ncbi:MAG: aspartate--tRNA(Asn) ligase [Nitrososphaerales archaeon]